MLRFLLLVSLTCPAWPSLLDRVAITVANDVVTELQVDEELRVVGFLNRQPIKRDLTARREAADRLVDQLIIKREMELSHYPMPSAEDVNAYLQKVKGNYPAPESFERQLSAYSLSEPTLKEHLTLQLTTLRFIELRFRPDADVSEADIETYYSRELSTWSATHSGNPPTLAASREAIRQTLLDERTNEVLDTWLEESRKQLNIVYLDKALQ